MQVSILQTRSGLAGLSYKVPDGTPLGLVTAVSLTRLCCCSTKTATDTVWKYMGMAVFRLNTYTNTSAGPNSHHLQTLTDLEKTGV